MPSHAVIPVKADWCLRLQAETALASAPTTLLAMDAPVTPWAGDASLGGSHRRRHDRHRCRHTRRRERQMINQAFSNAAEQRVSRWGGLAGIAGGILLVAVFAIVAVFVVAPAPEIAYTIMGFADVQAAHMVEEGLYLGVLALWAVHFVALDGYCARPAWRRPCSARP